MSVDETWSTTKEKRIDIYTVWYFKKNRGQAAALQQQQQMQQKCMDQEVATNLKQLYKTMKIGNSDILMSKVGYRYLSVAFQGILMVLGVENIIFSNEELEEEQAVGMVDEVVTVGSKLSSNSLCTTGERDATLEASKLHRRAIG